MVPAHPLPALRPAAPPPGHAGAARILVISVLLLIVKAVQIGQG